MSSDQPDSTSRYWARTSGVHPSRLQSLLLKDLKLVRPNNPKSRCDSHLVHHGALMEQIGVHLDHVRIVEDPDVEICSRHCIRSSERLVILIFKIP